MLRAQRANREQGGLSVEKGPLAEREVVAVALQHRCEARGARELLEQHVESNGTPLEEGHQFMAVPQLAVEDLLEQALVLQAGRTGLSASRVGDGRGCEPAGERGLVNAFAGRRIDEPR